MALFRPGQTGEAGCDGVSEANLWRLVVAVMSWHKGRRPGRLFSWRLSREVLEGIGGGAQVAVVTLSAPVVRHWYNRWGATPAEIAGTMPGDELVPLPKMTSTRAIAINAPPEDVWAWLVQIGQGRGGFYSFDALENLLRCDIHSADRIIPQLQELHTGDLIRLAPAQAPCYRVATVAPPASWCWLARTPRPGPCSPSPPARTSWPRRGSGYSVLLTAAGAPDWWPGSATATRTVNRCCGIWSSHRPSSWSGGCSTASKPEPRPASQRPSAPDAGKDRTYGTWAPGMVYSGDTLGGIWGMIMACAAGVRAGEARL